MLKQEGKGGGGGSVINKANSVLKQRERRLSQSELMVKPKVRRQTKSTTEVYQQDTLRFVTG